MRRTATARRLRLGALVAGVALALTGCSTGAAGSDPASTVTGGPAPIAASVAKRIDLVRDQTVATHGGNPISLDACTPKSAQGELPAVVIVHGGAWSSGTYSDLDWLCGEGAVHGFAAFTVGYRLLPTAFPDPLKDIAASIDWIRRPENAQRFHVDPDRIVLIGASAGGAMVSELLTGVPDSPLPPSTFRGGAMLSGIYDFPKLADQVTGDDRDSLVAYAGCGDDDASGCDDVLRSRSAIEALDGDDPPMFLANSTRELIPVDQFSEMRDAVKAAGVRSRAMLVEGDNHAEFIPYYDRSVDTAMWAFLTDVAG